VCAAQTIENLLSLCTDVGSIMEDPLAGLGTTIDVAKRMGRASVGERPNAFHAELARP
jgi:DNA modification methylase